MNKQIDIGTKIDLQKLIDTRLLIQAGSGGGKSWAIRKIAESVGDSVQQIILDPEGEFVTLREKFDFVLVSKEGDIPLSLRYAETLAHRILETGVSAIVDLYELKHHERILFVKRFLDALVNAPKELWHSCLVYVDEAHIFCPESSKSESMASVIDLCTRGRKRGFCAILATQRLSKLHKDAAAECLNKMIGRTGLDNDRKRSGDELDMNSKSDTIKLRELEQGEFYCFGPAISNEVKKFTVGPVTTTHLRSGKRITATPPTPNAVKKILSKLQDIPEEAERELVTKQDLQKEVTRLRGEVTRLGKQTKSGNSLPSKEEATQIMSLKKINVDLTESLKAHKKAIAIYEHRNTALYGQLTKIADAITNSHGIKIPEIGTNVQKSETIVRKTEIPVPKSGNPARYHGGIKEIIRIPAQQNTPQNISGGAMRMLKAAAMFHPESITKTRMAALARLSHSSGSFSTYLSTLKREGMITGEGNLYSITDAGIETAGPVNTLPTDPQELIELWCDVIGNQGGAARMLRELGAVYPNSITKQDLGQAVDMVHTSGSFSTYLSTLKRNGLIQVQNGSVKAAEELFN